MAFTAGPTALYAVIMVKKTVSDTGKGMDRQFMDENLFKPFQTTKKQGLGIGLWQIKHYVDLMGGDITVLTQENEGTKFTLSFPAAANSQTED